MPVQRTSLFGREHELSAIRDDLLLSEKRLVTLTGVGGCGKTRLAVQLAADLAPHYPQRTWIVELAPTTDADLVPIIVATTIGLAEFNATDPVAALSVFLTARPALLVLDNCEHLIDACAALVDRLLNSCPDLRVIATSREPLRVAGEHQRRVPPLDTPDSEASGTVDSIAKSPAVKLFVSRAQAALPSFKLTSSNAVTVARICSRLGGIPLALELAAARVRVLGIEQIHSRLDDSFRFLSGGSRVAPTRHQTLKAALDWSEALLTENERMVFRRLAVFAGEFQIETAEAVCSSENLPPADVFDSLTGLVNKSLVVAFVGESEAWYHLLEPVRQYALGKLQDRGEFDETRASHLAFYLNLAERSADEVRGPNQEAWLTRFEREQGNLRVALESAFEDACSGAALRLTAGLVPFWEAHGHLTEGLRWLREALTLPSNPAKPGLRMSAMLGAGRLSFFSDHSLVSQYTEAEELTTESLRLARELGDEPAIAAALSHLGMIHRLQRDAEISRACLEDALIRYRNLGDEHGVMLAMLNLASTTIMLGDDVEATRLLAETLERALALGDLRYTAVAQVGLGRTAHSHKAFEQAIQLIVRAMTTHLRLGDRWFVAFDLLALADVLIEVGSSREGVQLAGAAQALSDVLGTHVGGLSFENVHREVDALRRESWFEKVWNDGYALEPREAVLAARSLLDETGHHLRRAEPSPLTRRELEVAYLIAEGRTDRQIADALFLSVRTVGVHVHHILQKLELRSRVEVAAWLKTHGLAEADVLEFSPPTKS